MTMKTQLKTYVMQQTQFQEGSYSNIILPQEIRKTSNRQPNLILKQLEKKKKRKPSELEEGKKS